VDLLAYRLRRSVYPLGDTPLKDEGRTGEKLSKTGFSHRLLIGFGQRLLEPTLTAMGIQFAIMRFPLANL
jgi:hypothetical protein